MNWTPTLAVVLLSVTCAAAATPDAKTLLTQAVEAYTRNRAQEVHWNWIAFETRTVTGKDGSAQKLPDVTVESVIRNDGRRCNAVKSWGDGTPPYLANSDPDSRCQATEAFRPAFAVEELLKSANVRVVSRSPDVKIEVLPDKQRQKSLDPRVRCAASLKATVELDSTTSFPREIGGRVDGDGCVFAQQIPLYYGAQESAYTQTSFRKGASFRVVYELQADKFQTPEHSFWIRVEEHYDMPLHTTTGAMVYWGRSFRLLPGSGGRIVKDVQTTAQEFGTEVVVK